MTIEKEHKGGQKLHSSKKLLKAAEQQNANKGCVAANSTQMIKFYGVYLLRAYVKKS